MKKILVLTLGAALGSAVSAFAQASESRWTTLPYVTEAPSAEAADAGSSQGSFNKESVAALFESAAASKPSADALVGIWLQVARASDAGAVYNSQGLPRQGRQKLVFFSAKGNPFAVDGIKLFAYVDAMKGKVKPAELSFDERTAKFGAYECRQIDETHMLCKVSENGQIRFEGFWQTKKGQDN